MTKDLQKQIEELEEVAESHVDFSDWDQGKAYAAQQALSIIKQLQDEVDKYKLLWESACEGANVIIAEQEEQIRVLKEKLLKIRGENNDK